MLSAVVSRARLGAAAWAERRQGRDGTAALLTRRRIYIVPSRFGVAFAALLFAMLLGSLNYSASLGFALTFLLAGVGLVAMHHCRNNLLGLRVRFAGARPVFAGDRAEYRIALSNDAAVPRYEVAIERNGRTAELVDLGAEETRTLRLAVPTEKRGWQTLDRFAVVTRHPGNLFRAWAWIHMDARCLVYPQLAPPGRPLPPDGGGGNSSLRATLEGDADFVGMRAAQPGDPPARIAWKAYARNDELLLKQFASGEQTPRLLCWDSLPDLDNEARLSQLARWCTDCAAIGCAFGLQLPGRTVPLGNGEGHLHECLQALALFPHAGRS